MSPDLQSLIRNVSLTTTDAKAKQMDFELADRHTAASNTNTTANSASARSSGASGSSSGYFYPNATAATTMNPLPPPPPPPAPSSGMYGMMMGHAGIPPPPPPPPPSQQGTSAVPAKTLDQLADEFLSGPLLSSSDSEQSAARPPHTIVLAPDPLPANASDLERLQILVSRRAWSDVLLYTNQLKHGTNSHFAPLYRSILGHTPSVSADLALGTHQQELVYILLVHIEALVKLGSFKELAQEVRGWIFCHHQKGEAALPSNQHPESARPGQGAVYSWIPWSLHIAAAATLQFGDGSGSGSSESTSTNNASMTTTVTPPQQRCLDALWAIRSDIAKDDVSARMQVENALTNVFVSIKDWRMALTCLQHMLDIVPAVASAAAAMSPPSHGNINTSESTRGTTASAQSLSLAWQTELWSRQGRIFLQAGALDQASVMFQRASTAWKDFDDAVSTTAGAVQNIPAQLMVNDGLLKFSHGQHNEALECFHSAVRHLRRHKASTSATSNSTNRSLDLPGSTTTVTSLLPALGSSSASDADAAVAALYSETINNMALCALYTCRLPQALHLLESLIREDVTHHLTDRVALNLCTLYELASDTAASARKKRVLQLVARRFQLHDIKAESFRVS